MPDRDKVIKGFECCVIQVFKCQNCTYGDVTTDLSVCHDVLLKDALELLKEQGPVMWSYDYDCIKCSNCGLCIKDEVYYMMDKPILFCPACGRKVKWDAAD